MSIWCTTLFHFLLKKVLETYEVHYTILFIAFEFIFILSRFSISLKSLNNYFFRRFPYKSLLNRFSVLINCIMCSSNHCSTSSCFPRFSGSRCFRVQVFQRPGPGFRSSLLLAPGFLSRNICFHKIYYAQ